MGMFPCTGNYGSIMMTRANQIQEYAVNTETNKWDQCTVSLNPVNTCKTVKKSNIYHMSNTVATSVDGERVYTPIDNFLNLQTMGFLGEGSLSNGTIPDVCNRCVITVQKFGDWKRTLTGFWLTAEGYTLSSESKHLVDPARGTAIAAASTVYDTSLNIVKTYTESLYDTTKYDDYLIPIGVYYYNEDTHLIDNVTNIIDGFGTPYYKYIPSTKSWDIYKANLQGVQISPDNVIFNGFSNMPRYNNWLSSWNIAEEIGGSTVGVYNLTSVFSEMAPYITIYYNKNTERNEIYSAPSYEISAAYTAFIFPDFAAIQKWYIDFGIKAYENYADLQIDNFPDDLEQDIGFPDNNNPDPIESLPNNTSDPTEFSDPDIQPESAYKLYALNFPMYLKTKRYLITQDFFTALKQFFTNPLESILGCVLFPFDFYSHNSNSLNAETEIEVINYTIEDINCYSFLPQYPFHNFNLGSKYIQAYYGNYLDYQAKYTLYVPFCGCIDLEASNVVNHTIYLRCVISALSGGGTVYVTNELGKLLGTISGTFGANLSFNSSNYAQTLQTAIFSAMPSSIAALASPTAAFEALGKFASTMWLTPQHNGLRGSLDSNTGFGGICTAFMRVSLPIPTQPSSYNKLAGIESQYYASILSLQGSGFVAFSDIDVSSIPCTSEEREMILALLKSGIYT